jgi:hypothetical protein
VNTADVGTDKIEVTVTKGDKTTPVGTASEDKKTYTIAAAELAKLGAGDARIDVKRINTTPSSTAKKNVGGTIVTTYVGKPVAIKLTAAAQPPRPAHP